MFGATQGDTLTLPNNRLPYPLDLTAASAWSLTGATLAPGGTAPNGVTTEDAFALRETASGSHHSLNHAVSLPALPSTPLAISISAKTVNTRRLAIRVHCLNSSGAVIDSKYTHFLYFRPPGIGNFLPGNPLNLVDYRLFWDVSAHRQ